MHSAVITTPKKQIFAVLDIGTTKIACIIFNVNSHNTVEVLGVGYKKSTGIYSGTVINAKEALASVSQAIEAAEKDSGEIIEEIYINVSGTKVSSQIFSTTITDINNKVTTRDIRRIFNQSNENINNHEAIIHNIPVEYTLDNIRGISDPTGMYGSIMKVTMHTITMSNSSLLNLQHCVTKNQIYFKGCTISAYSSCVSCINEDEQKLGITVIDIGGGSTSVGIFKEGSLIYASSIPMGGILITRDIASVFNINITDAEKIKVLKGNVIPTNQSEIIEVAPTEDSNEAVQISSLDLTNVILSRTEEILEMVKNDIKDKITNRVIITGGTSQLTGIREVAANILGSQIRLGVPQKLLGMEKYNQNPSLSAAVGSITLIANLMNEDNSSKKKIFKRILNFIKGS